MDPQSDSMYYSKYAKYFKKLPNSNLLNMFKSSILVKNNREIKADWNIKAFTCCMLTKKK